MSRHLCSTKDGFQLVCLCLRGIDHDEDLFDIPVPADNMAEALRLLNYALIIRMHGERAPGGDENWAQFDTDTELFLRHMLSVKP